MVVMEIMMTSIINNAISENNKIKYNGTPNDILMCYCPHLISGIVDNGNAGKRERLYIE